MKRLAVLVLAALTMAAASAHAGLAYDPGIAGFTPRVPISALGRASSWFDPSRLHLASTVTVGSGFGSNAQTSALQVTSLSYAFKAPLTMQVRVGNAFGAGAAQNGSSFFLEGLDVAYQPSANTMFRVQFQNVRSPLQLNRWGAYPGDWGW